MIHIQQKKEVMEKNVLLLAGIFPWLYRMFNHRGNGLSNEPRVAHFSVTALPFPASENADVR
jgi:hypothetical protein